MKPGTEFVGQVRYTGGASSVPISAPGTNNLFIGSGAGSSLTTGTDNLAIGLNALFSNTTGTYNVAIGEAALYANIVGQYNVAIGYKALTSNNVTGNVAIGVEALELNVGGDYNTAIGMQALKTAAQGDQNTAIGFQAMVLYAAPSPIIGNNVAIGYQAGYNYNASEYSNIVIGYNKATAGENNMLRIGNPNAGTPTGQVAFSMLGLKGFGLSPIYGLDNRHGLTAVDASATTLYTTTAANQLYKLTARLLATAGTSPSATYVIKWTEGGAVITKTLTISAIDTDADLSTILIQPDNATAITAQLTAISGTSTTVNVASTVEEIA